MPAPTGVTVKAEPIAEAHAQCRNGANTACPARTLARLRITDVADSILVPSLLVRIGPGRAVVVVVGNLVAVGVQRLAGWLLIDARIADTIAVSILLSGIGHVRTVVRLVEYLVVIFVPGAAVDAITNIAVFVVLAGFRIGFAYSHA